MNTIGSLLLLVSVALVLIVSIMSVSDISGQALGSNDSHIVSQASSVNSVTNPIFYVLGFLVLALGAVIAIDAFR